MHYIAVATTSKAPEKPLTQGGIGDFAITAAVLGWVGMQIVQPILKKLVSGESEESKRVTQFIEFQQSQLKELTSAISDQTESISKLTASVETLLIMLGGRKSG